MIESLCSNCKHKNAVVDAEPCNSCVENDRWEKTDNVNSPAHYTQGKIEVIDFLESVLTPEEYKGFLKGNILKYTSRERLKGGVEDIKKAEWYKNKLIALMEREK